MWRPIATGLGMAERVLAHFQHKRGTIVRYAADPQRPYCVYQLRVTVRDRRGAVLELGIAPVHDPDTPLLRWVAETDCTRWRWGPLPQEPCP